ncbi:MAG: hypothetical protein ACYCSO_01170 [Cuniculiplasma sp.]
MDISLDFMDNPKTLEIFSKCLTPENDKRIDLKWVSQDHLIITIKSVKLTSLYSLTDEFLKIKDLISEVTNKVTPEPQD